MALRFSIPRDAQARLNMLRQLHDACAYRTQGHPVAKPKPISPANPGSRSVPSGKGHSASGISGDTITGVANTAH